MVYNLDTLIGLWESVSPPKKKPQREGNKEEIIDNRKEKRKKKGARTLRNPRLRNPIIPKIVSPAGR